MPVQRPTPPSPPRHSVGKSFHRRRGLHAETAQSALMVILKLVTGGLTSIILIVLSTVNLRPRVCLFPFPQGHFSELWQLMSWLQPGHHVVNLFHLVGLSVSVTQLASYGSEYDL